MADSVLGGIADFDVKARLAGAAGTLRSLAGWRRLGVAVGIGAISALAYAPFHVWPILFLTFPALVFLIDGVGDTRRPWLAAAFVGSGFGYGYFFVGLHWVGFAFVVDAERHAWLLPFVAVTFPGGLALFFAAAAGIVRLRWPVGPARVALLAAALGAVEWLRGHVLTGFPWNLPGYTWSGIDAMYQSASVFGIYGLSLVTLIATLLPAAMIDANGARLRSLWPIAASVSILVALFLFGWLRLPTVPAPVFSDVALRIVQPNVPQGEKWKPELLERNWRLLIDLTRRPGLENRTHVIWPEAAPPFLLLAEPAGLEVIAQVLSDETNLLTGVVRIEGEGEARRFFNSMAAISGEGRVLASYDKAHLVPFGEYLPLYRILEPLGVTKITGGREGYSEGPGVRTLTIPHTPSFGPLICYEVIFPGEVVEPGQRPQWLVTMTDDSWFGPWTGPYQHLGIAKVRAAEEGLPIVRAANTGVSAVIDPFGRIVASLGLDETGVVDAALPRPLAPTLYTFVGDAIFAILLIALTGVGLFFYRSAQQGS
jgi:apolipoprotein N-acyltransferase